MVISSYPSRPVPAAEASVQEVVGTTFEQEVLKNANDVVLCFYSPWGEHSDYFHPIYEELAAQVRGRAEAARQVEVIRQRQDSD